MLDLYSLLTSPRSETDSNK